MYLLPSNVKQTHTHMHAHPTHTQTYTHICMHCKCSVRLFDKLRMDKQFLPSVYVVSLFMIIQYFIFESHSHIFSKIVSVYRSLCNHILENIYWLLFPGKRPSRTSSWAYAGQIDGCWDLLVSQRSLNLSLIMPALQSPWGLTLAFCSGDSTYKVLSLSLHWNPQ